MKDTFIGHCRRCKLTRRFEAPVTQTHRGDAGYGRKTWTNTRDVTAASPFVGSERPHFAREFHDRPRTFWLKCPAGHNVEFKQVMGVTTDKRCDARCEGATGNCCECACGGKNHGSAHV